MALSSRDENAREPFAFLYDKKTVNAGGERQQR
jgi:hypothetical protein